MSLVRWQPFQELDLLRRQMDRLFGDMSTLDRDFWNRDLAHPQGVMGIPAVELLEKDTEFVLKAQVPGIESKDLDIRVSPDSVVIAGEHRGGEKTEEPGYFRSEFYYGQFRRTISLPVSIQQDQVKADFKDGVLILTLPKVVETTPQVVKVDVGQQ